MKTLSQFFLVASFLFASCETQLAQPAADNDLSEKECTVNTFDDYEYLTPDETEAEDLVFMREEEKLAHDVYVYFYNMYGARIFNNISASEYQHSCAVLDLLNRYEITDPATDTEAGVFVNEQLQSLYNQLIEQGSQSYVEALKVGALIEEVDILDLDKAIDETDNADIATVYTNLLRGSGNHLRAFVRQLGNQGVSYTPQVLSEEEYNSILNN